MRSEGGPDPMGLGSLRGGSQGTDTHGGRPREATERDGIHTPWEDPALPTPRPRTPAFRSPVALSQPRCLSQPLRRTCPKRSLSCCPQRPRTPAFLRSGLGLPCPLLGPMLPRPPVLTDVPLPPRDTRARQPQAQSGAVTGPAPAAPPRGLSGRLTEPLLGRGVRGGPWDT